MDIGPWEAEAFWTEFSRELTRCGLRDVKLVISDAHKGLKAAISRVLNATWQCCRVHFMRNVLSRARRNGHRLVAAFIGTIFAQDSETAAKSQCLYIVNGLRVGHHKLATFMDQAEEDVLVFMDFSNVHRTKLHSTNPIER